MQIVLFVYVSCSSLGWDSFNVSLKFIVHIGIPMSWDAVAGIVNQSLLTTNGNSTIQFGNAYIYDGKFLI